MNEALKNRCRYCKKVINKQPTDNPHVYNAKDEGFCSLRCYNIFDCGLQIKRASIKKIELLAEKLFIKRVNKAAGTYGISDSVVDVIFHDSWAAAKRFYDLLYKQGDEV